MNAKVSIITPSFRNSRWLRLCVASVADQGVPCEHIVHDAGSDDGTLDWLPHDKRVKAFIEKDSGMYDAINRGLRKATADILAYLNCDEQYLPGTLDAVVRFFADHGDVQVAFAYTVAVNERGEYLFHRKVQTPLLNHTWTHPLSVLTCATFFRRTLIDKNSAFFDTSYKITGDAEWVLRLIRQRVSMGILRRFTSAFTITGQNLSVDPRADEEKRRLASTAPSWVRLAGPAILLHHRVRRWLGGVYRQPPFKYAVYTLSKSTSRETFEVRKPTSKWRW